MATKAAAPMPVFKPGDIVKLKSGGPKMSVHDLVAVRNRVVCTWFAGSKAERAEFHPDTLTTDVDEPKK